PPLKRNIAAAARPLDSAGIKFFTAGLRLFTLPRPVPDSSPTDLSRFLPPKRNIAALPRPLHSRGHQIFLRNVSARARSHHSRGGPASRACEGGRRPATADDTRVGRAGGRALPRVRTRKEEEDRMSLRKLGANKRWPLLMVVAMFLSGISPSFMSQSTVSAQVVAGGAPVGQGFVINADDLRFIYEQILVAQEHAAGGSLLGGGPNQVSDPQLPRGLRTVDGSFNNLVPVPDQHMFGAADRLFPRLLVPRFRTAQGGTSYQQVAGTVIDSEPRTISNLIVD